MYLAYNTWVVGVPCFGAGFDRLFSPTGGPVHAVSRFEIGICTYVYVPLLQTCALGCESYFLSCGSYGSAGVVGKRGPVRPQNAVVAAGAGAVPPPLPLPRPLAAAAAAAAGLTNVPRAQPTPP